MKNEGESIMLWGCVLAISTGNITQVDGRMDSSKYQEILEAKVAVAVKILKLKRDWLLQQDSDPK